MLILNILKGILMGIANIMPGVSGGTLAISLGVYDRIIEAISHIFQDFRKSFQTLFPLMVGMFLGIVCFTYLLEFLFVSYPFPVCLAFMGLILGGLPSLCSAYKNSMYTPHRNQAAPLFSPFHLSLFLTFAIITISMSFTSDPLQNRAALTADIHTFIILFFLGIIAAGTMIIPGVSGTLILMILGYYYEILSTIKSMIDGIRTLNMELFRRSLVLLIPFGIGLVLGIFLFSKLVEYLFQYHAAAAYSAIIGLITASPVAILISTNALSHATPTGIMIGSIVFLLGIFVTKIIGE